MNKTILIAGNGKLAHSISNGLSKYIDTCRIDGWENNERYPDSDKVIVHIGSGRQFDDVFAFCERTKTPLIQGSTEITSHHTGVTFTYIDAPNFNLLMLKFMCMLKDYGAYFKDDTISIVESHQKSKTTLAGTAVEFAQSLGIPPSEIKSIRNPDVQKSIYGISNEDLALHAMHEISIGDGNTLISLKTLVKGHESYVSGLAAILRSLDNLEERYYHISDLIEMKAI